MLRKKKLDQFFEYSTKKSEYYKITENDDLDKKITLYDSV